MRTAEKILFVKPDRKRTLAKLLQRWEGNNKMGPIETVYMCMN
jgi:hypothetical protein